MVPHYIDTTSGSANEATLKVDFVNDSAPRFGAVVCGTLFPRIDSLRNMLSNKVTVRWRERPDEEPFYSDLAVIASDLLAVRENSLYRARRSASAW